MSFPAPGAQIAPPGPDARDADRLRALWHVSRRWGERLDWACTLRRLYPDLQQRINTGGGAEPHETWCLAAYGGISFWRQARLNGLLAEGERHTRGLRPFRLRMSTNPGPVDAAWDPLTDPLPGIDAVLTTGYYPLMPDVVRRQTFRQSLAYICQWLLTQSVHIHGLMDYDWSQCTLVERSRYGAVAFVGSLYSAEIAAVAGMALPRQPFPDYVPGVGYPAVYAPPEHPVWRPAFTTMPNAEPGGQQPSRLARSDNRLDG
ncbi:MAG TPA: hypothetical protein DCS97_05785 [Planctomycetes bacterium]|nr:hypothetical protein [Planctomycetota bacterium]